MNLEPASRGAWVRTDDTTYGSGKFPFGPCAECDKPACFEIPGGKKTRRVCLAHKPSEIIFVPFLGQQTKLFTATERWVLGGGGAGGSKTYCGSRLWLKQYTREQARYEQAKAEGREFTSKGWAIFFRRTMPELLQVIEDFKKYYLKIDPNARWVEQQKLCVFSNGYKVQFGGMEDDDGYLRYYGGEYTLVVIDEATQFTKKQIMEIDARLRCSDEVLDQQVQMYLLTNPVGGETKQWLRARFVKVAPPETRVRIKTKLADGRVISEWQVYIPSNLFDNPSLVASGRYEASLMQKGSAMRRALLLNDWDIDEGCWVGDDWDPSVHVVRPHPIPKTWSKFKCADYGFSSRASVLWFAVDPDGGLVCYRAWSCRLLTAQQFADKIKEIESVPLIWKDPDTGKRITIVEREWDDGVDCSTVFGPMDAACWAKQGESGQSRGETLENAGTGFFKSDKGSAVRHSAADQIRFRLKVRHPNPFGGEGDVAGLRFFYGTTETRIPDQDRPGGYKTTGPTHTIPVLPIDPKDPDVWDTNADDHDMDALEYGVMSRPAPNEEPLDNEVIDFMTLRAPAKNSEKIAW